MKALICSLCLMLLFCGCGKKAEEPKVPDNTSSQYIDAHVDFTGKKTIVGRWKCVTETQNGETRDASGDSIYYIFSSDGTLDTFYRGAKMDAYSGYKVAGNKVTLESSSTAVTLTFEVTETSLTLSMDNGSISTVYERVPYEK